MSISGKPILLRTHRRGPRGWIPVCLALALAVLGTLAVAAPTWAASPKEQAKVEFEKAQIQYKLGHFQEALERYSRAYELFPAPAFLFNIGQCQRSLKNYERAIFFFEGYLRDEKVRANRTLAEELIAESKAELEKQRSRSQPPVPQTNPPAAGPPPILTAPAPPAPAPQTSSGALAPSVALGPAPSPTTESTPISGSTPEGQQHITRTWWFWTTIGVAVLAGTGSVLYWGANGNTLVPPSGTVGTLDRR